MAKTKRQSIKEIRRKELVEAARDVIAEKGYENTTIAMIAERAGFSVGYLHHHFSSKDALLLELIRVINADMSTLLASEFPQLPDPLDRILVIIEANLGPSMFLASNAPAWMSFLARTRFNPDFARFYQLLRRRMHSNLVPQLRPFMEDRQAARLTEDLYALLDGYWVHLATAADGVSSEEAMAGAIRFLDCALDGRLGQRCSERQGLRAR